MMMIHVSETIPKMFYLQLKTEQEKSPYQSIGHNSSPEPGGHSSALALQKENAWLLKGLQSSQDLTTWTQKHLDYSNAH